ncbi:copper homeostasis protein CutC [Rhizobium sp. SSA_523]|uniref:copper homeostasis protein CutC n=1 Tax=Rhizobium sp. SSA_523 TaxID=2952477 RepID=UPI002090F1D1|nr:copper homeostasis protein CutC [Rhizobium sp. SSA_523]MCO5732309.1 copper homeostasis protein CutC [Rhizobium sp. SSA_523]WKC21289.1 copper homeostasis protein CutC [Rhizobium sp. SSA_523]
MQASSPQGKPVLEICVDNAEGLFAAIEGGADRIELCFALSVGGLTPSRGFMELAGRQPIPCYAMIRPRAGNFQFTPEEVLVMKADIDAARAAGLTGVVIGACRSDGRLDEEVLGSLCRHAAGLDLTLHRAFDTVPDKHEALETAIRLGFSRILTSGGQQTAMQGMDQLADLIQRAAGRITIMPGSGVRPDNAAHLIERLGASELHASCSSRTVEENTTLVELSFAAREALKTSASCVAALRKILHGEGAAC